MNQPFQFAPEPIYQTEKPVRNDLYNRLPSAAWSATREIDPVHIGRHEFGARAYDVACLPGCRKCQREFEANAKAIGARHQLDFLALIQDFSHHLSEPKPRRPL
jgi:hypothetical protein